MLAFLSLREASGNLFYGKFLPFWLDSHIYPGVHLLIIHFWKNLTFLFYFLCGKSTHLLDSLSAVGIVNDVRIPYAGDGSLLKLGRLSECCCFCSCRRVSLPSLQFYIAEISSCYNSVRGFGTVHFTSKVPFLVTFNFKGTLSLLKTVILTLYFTK